MDVLMFRLPSLHQGTVDRWDWEVQKGEPDLDEYTDTRLGSRNVGTSISTTPFRLTRSVCDRTCGRVLPVLYICIMFLQPRNLERTIGRTWLTYYLRHTRFSLLVVFRNARMVTLPSEHVERRGL